MAIVRILKSTKSFEGVGYNENRCKRNEAKLLVRANFGEAAAFMDDVTYLNKWSGTNTRIKNKQLHVVISAKGNDLTDDELKQMGIEWLNKMGYSDNPFLIYLHKHSDNNHIHIITSRVDKEGKKINDKFEKERAVICLNEIQGIDNRHKCEQLIEELTKFSFSTKYQFSELLRLAGFKVYITDEGLDCKYGDSVINLDNKWIEHYSKINKRDIDLKYKKKLQGLIFKYAAQLSKDNFARFMKDNFGLQFIFYGKDNTINGYTIIDYQTKSVYKGSEVFSLNRIKELLDIPENPAFELDLYLQETFARNKFITSRELNEIMHRDLGYSINNNFYLKDDEEEGIPMNEKLYGRLAYNDRLMKAVIAFRPHDDLQCYAIANLYKLKVDDVILLSQYYNNSVNVSLDFYRFLLDDALSNHKSLRHTLDLNNIAIVFKGDDFVLIDAQNGNMVSSSELGVNVNEVKDNISEFKVSSLTGDVVLDSLPTDEEEYFTLDLPSFSGFGLFYAGTGGGGSSNRKKKKRKTD